MSFSNCYLKESETGLCIENIYKKGRPKEFNERELAIVNYFTEEIKTLCEVAEKEKQ